MVRRRRDQLHSGRGVAHPANVLVHLVARQLSALTRLRTLRHLDLEVRGVAQVVYGYAESAGRHLLHRAAAGVAVGVQRVPVIVLAALACVAARSDAVHRDRHRLVRLAADRAEGDCARGETLHNLAGWLHFFQVNWLVHPLELKQAADCAVLLAQPVRERGELPVARILVRPRRVLKRGDGIGVPHVVLALAAPLVAASARQPVCVYSVGLPVPAPALFLYLGETHTTNPRRRPGEVPVDHLLVQPDRLEDLGAPVSLQCGHPHLRYDLQNPLVGGLEVVVLGVLIRRRIGQLPIAAHARQRLQSQVRVDRSRAVTGKQGEVRDLPRLSRLDGDSDPGARALADQVVVYGGCRQQTGNRSAGRIGISVRKHQYRAPFLDGSRRLVAQPVQRLL